MTKQVNEQLEEQLSAMFDGEASELELRRVLQQLDEMTEADRQAFYSQWQGFQLGSDSLQGHLPTSMANSDFASKVSGAIAEEASHDNAPNIDQPAFNESTLQHHSGQASMPHAEVATPVWSKFAVAASVALAVIVGFQQYQINDQQAEIQLAKNTPPIETYNFPSPSVVGSGSEYASFDASQPIVIPSVESMEKNATTLTPLEAAEAQRRLNDYIMQYNRARAQQ